MEVARRFITKLVQLGDQLHGASESSRSYDQGQATNDVCTWQEYQELLNGPYQKERWLVEWFYYNNNLSDDEAWCNIFAFGKTQAQPKLEGDLPNTALGNTDRMDWARTQFDCNSVYFQQLSPAMFNAIDVQPLHSFVPTTSKAAVCSTLKRKRQDDHWSPEPEPSADPSYGPATDGFGPAWKKQKLQPLHNPGHPIKDDLSIATPPTAKTSTWPCAPINSTPFGVTIVPAVAPQSRFSHVPEPNFRGGMAAHTVTPSKSDQGLSTKSSTNGATFKRESVYQAISSAGPKAVNNITRSKPILTIFITPPCALPSSLEAIRQAIAQNIIPKQHSTTSGFLKVPSKTWKLPHREDEEEKNYYQYLSRRCKKMHQGMECLCDKLLRRTWEEKKAREKERDEGRKMRRGYKSSLASAVKGKAKEALKGKKVEVGQKGKEGQKVTNGPKVQNRQIKKSVQLIANLPWF